MKRKLYIIMLCMLATIVAGAQSHTLTVEVEPVVHVNENFKLRYVLNSTDARNFNPGNIPDAFEVLIGPTQSTSISTVIINGNRKTTQTLTLTYVLSASKTGKFTIPAASVSVGGETVKSQPQTIQVIASNEHPAAHSGGSANDFFIMATATKRHVSVFEPFLLTFKVCWHPDLPVINLDPITLELQNVYMQPYNDTQQKSKKVENINGRVLVTVDWQQYVVYPQKAGVLEIPSMKLKGYIREDVAFDPFDPFSSGYREVARQLSSPQLNIQVDELTDKPADFSGGVGHFSIDASLDNSEVKENTPVTVKVTVSGRGNFNMLREPTLVFPRGFDTYDTKQTENYQVTADGLSGSVTYDFVAVPQRKGNFVIPPARLTYFDLQSRSYQTVQTDSFRINVLKGDGTSSTLRDYSGDNVQQTGDIHGIKTGIERPSSGQTFFASVTYFLILAILVLSFIVCFVILRLREKSQADVTKTKGKRANKVAVKKLRKAAKLMKENNLGGFYDETLRALWGYVGDKLNIPVSQLSRENISQRLQERGVDEQITSRFIEAIDECEFVRYAPGDAQGNMSRVYEKSITAIEQIESVKKVKKTARQQTLGIVLMLVMTALSSSSAWAQTKVQADEAYSQEEYEEAIAIYEQLAQKGTSAEVYYNMGNAYYRLDSMAKAILCYERALRLQPGDEDALFNLQLASSKTVDKIAPEREMFFVTWYHALVSFLSVDTWALLAVIFLLVAVVLWLLYFFAYGEQTRRWAFFGAILLVVLFLLCNIFAWRQKKMLSGHDDAIVMQETVGVKNIPSDEGNDDFTIHAGTKVKVIDSTMSDWKQISLPDGREGWVKPSSFEVI
ncbi:MAG: BatD family protein [Prevotella sp.]|nr:BatD family protein [Prevotella sp.]